MVVMLTCTPLLLHVRTALTMLTCHTHLYGCHWHYFNSQTSPAPIPSTAVRHNLPLSTRSIIYVGACMYVFLYCIQNSISLYFLIHYLFVILLDHSRLIDNRAWWVFFIIQLLHSCPIFSFWSSSFSWLLRRFRAKKMFIIIKLLQWAETRHHWFHSCPGLFQTLTML